MPFYDYGCPDCGPFTASRPMAQYDQPHDCPECGASSERVILTMPAFAGMDPVLRKSEATNERSRNSPRKLNTGSHPSGCGCCKTKPGGRTRLHADGAQDFPTARPWMISH